MAGPPGFCFSRKSEYATPETTGGRQRRVEIAGQEFTVNVEDANLSPGYSILAPDETPETVEERVARSLQSQGDYGI